MMRTCVLIAAALTLCWGCEDNSEFCADWQASGWCSEYRDQLQEMCAKTCGFCGGGGGDGGDPGVAVDPRPAREPETPNLCRDTCSTKDCIWLKGQGHCELYSAVMMENCASTCGWCGARMCSPPDVENGWTDFEMTMIPAGANVNVFCYEGFESVGSAVLGCNGNGDLDGYASCRGGSDEYGNEYAVQLTDCQRAAQAATVSSFKDGQYVIPQASTHYVPKCDYSGNFAEIQFDSAKGDTFCVDVYRGTEIQGTRIKGVLDYISCNPGAAAEYYASLEQDNDYPSYDYGSSGGYDQGGYDYNSGYDQGGYESYDQGGYDQGGYESYDQGGYDQGGYESYDQGGYDQGGYESYDQGGYDQGGYEYETAGGEDYYNYDTASGDDYYGGDSGYETAGGEDYYNYDTSAGDDYYGGYETAGGEDYYNYDTSAGGGYYAEGGDAFDGSSYYAETSETDIYSGRYYDTGDVEAEEDFSLSEGAEGAEGDAVAALVVDAAEEIDAEMAMSKDANEKRKKRKKLRNKRDADEEDFEQ